VASPIPPVSAEPRGNRFSRPFFFVLGILFVILGYIGVVLPVMPGTIFFILALNAFRRSNAKLEHWLLYRTRFGPALRDWDEHGWITKRVKTIIVILVWGSIIGSSMTVMRRFPDRMVASGLICSLVLTASLVSWYILSRPTKPA